ncbi:MAG TPA: hypothetical protein VHL08_07495 [Dongiaceae bacterium]|nr:hypothetical protein [Dongiaceae bacterium]
MKNSEQFFAACFELEVASYHVAGGSTVEFLEEKENKTPDLKVTLKNGTSFLVECKAIDIKSDRDLKYESMWKRVEQTILEYMNQRKLNYLILVRALCDPNPADVDYLIDLIIKGLNQGGMGELWGDQSGIAIGPDPTGRYLIYVKFLSAPDEQMREGSLELYFQDEPSRWTCVKEAMFNEKGEHFFRNLKAFHFSTALPSDRMPSVLNALNAATKQLPSEGPGVVWIKVPETWIYGEDNNFLKVENLLRKKMTGDHNRRINRVVLITSKMERFSENGVPKLIFRPIFSEIDHNNPRSKLDWGS